MDFHCKTAEETLKFFGSDPKTGLTENKVVDSALKYGKNFVEAKKKNGFMKRLFGALAEPMMTILLIGFLIAFGTKFGSFLKTGEADFSECFGILAAIALSVTITLVMEGSSEKAFLAMNGLCGDLSVKVIRDGKVVSVSQRFVVCGDVILLSAGDKIVADGRLIECDDLTLDESALTGESHPGGKTCAVIRCENVPIAERKNCVYSGTFVKTGTGKMVVTSVGKDTETGKIAGELTAKDKGVSPLSHKLAALGKTISAVGTTFAVAVFVTSVIRLAVSGSLSFDGVQELFISCIITIVAAVPEGLPTIVAVSLALNMIKLAKENALIKKMVATETMGSVSVICSDKTGTLTENKMTLVKFVGVNGKTVPVSAASDEVIQNFVCNSSAEKVYENDKEVFTGSGTECALLCAFEKEKNQDSVKYRKSFEVTERVPFDSDKKYMVTAIYAGGGIRLLIKGAPERVLERCALSPAEKNRLIGEMKNCQSAAERVIMFAHKDFKKGDSFDAETENGLVCDGYAVLSDPIRKDAYKAVEECKSAGIRVIMLTGDNETTALAIAKKLGIAKSEKEAVNAVYLEGLSDEALIKALKRISVIARSTPMTKLRVVRALKSSGEVVAVTGDGVNDAPAIKHADVGVAMGKSGSEITKEAADVVLLDDSFATVVKAVAFGRNVYRNLQRFITFQLSVNVSALLFITIAALMGLTAPFNTLQLLWINVIMDGPPALTLGLTRINEGVMRDKPVGRTESIVSVKMLLRILFNGVFIGTVMVLQYVFNFLGASGEEVKSATFTLFVAFQLFNAFNSAKLGSESIFKNAKDDKIMIFTFAGVFVLHAFIVQVCYKPFGISPMSALLWVKCVLTAVSIVLITEIFKCFYRKAAGVKKAAARKKGFSRNVLLPGINKNRATGID